MRRYTFYLAVALVAFGIGSLAVFKFYWITEVKPIVAEEQKIITEAQTEKNFGTGVGSGSATNEQINAPAYIRKLIKPTCGNSKLLPFWKEIRKDKEFRQRAAEEFYFEADCSAMLDVKKIDLNDDGRKEIVLQGNNPNLCARDDCLVWIFEKKGSKYKQILQSWATSDREISNYTDERGLKIRKAKSKGYKIIAAIGGRSTLRIQHTYQFDGNRYQESECLTFEYQVTGEQYMETCEEKWKE